MSAVCELARASRPPARCSARMPCKRGSLTPCTRCQERHYSDTVGRACFDVTPRRPPIFEWRFESGALDLLGRPRRPRGLRPRCGPLVAFPTLQCADSPLHPRRTTACGTRTLRAIRRGLEAPVLHGAVGTQPMSISIRPRFGRAWGYLALRHDRWSNPSNLGSPPRRILPLTTWPVVEPFEPWKPATTRE